jgi:hypothetical protein
MPFISFMMSPLGRTLRIALGVMLMMLGITRIGGTFGLVVATVGLLPIVAGVFNFCLASPLFGCDINGRRRAGGAR